MIDLSVVVLPAPLRPRRVTISPAWISKSTPCRTWDSPYHAWRSRTASSGSGMGGAHVRLDDVGVPGDAGIVALGQHLAPGQHRDGVTEVLDHAQVVLDHQHRALGGDALDEVGDAGD